MSGLLLLPMYVSAEREYFFQLLPKVTDIWLDMLIIWLWHPKKNKKKHHTKKQASKTHFHVLLLYIIDTLEVQQVAGKQLPLLGGRKKKWHNICSACVISHGTTIVFLLWQDVGCHLRPGDNCAPKIDVSTNMDMRGRGKKESIHLGMAVFYGMQSILV